jgi:hypothetical protein
MTTSPPMSIAMYSRYRLLVRSLAALAIAVATCAADAQTDKKPESAGPYVPTPWVIVDEIMKLAEIGPDDFVIDLGSGDGRLVITAATRYGARGGFGVDIDESLVKLANENAAKEGVGGRVRFLTRDLFATSVSDATVVTLYLLPTSVPKLESKLLAELRPGARVVSHDYPFPNWPHDRLVKLDVAEKVNISGTPRTALYLYTVPARISGEWELTLPAALAARPVRLSLAQKPIGTTGTVVIGDRTLALSSVKVEGERVTLVLPALGARGGSVTLRGKATASGDVLEGTVNAAEAWRAIRRGG